LVDLGMRLEVVVGSDMGSVEGLRLTLCFNLKMLAEAGVPGSVSCHPDSFY